MVIELLSEWPRWSGAMMMVEYQSWSLTAPVAASRDTFPGTFCDFDYVNTLRNERRWQCCWMVGVVVWQLKCGGLQLDLQATVKSYDMMWQSWLTLFPPLQFARATDLLTAPKRPFPVGYGWNDQPIGKITQEEWGVQLLKHTVAEETNHCWHAMQCVHLKMCRQLFRGVWTVAYTIANATRRLPATLNQAGMKTNDNTHECWCTRRQDLWLKQVGLGVKRVLLLMHATPGATVEALRV